MNTMRRTLVSLLTILSLLVTGLMLTSCTNDPATPTEPSVGNATSTPDVQDVQPAENKFKSYSEDQWLSESFDGKAISYQMVSPELNDSEIANGFAFAECINLYDDGSVLVDHRNAVASKTDFYYGYWTREESDYGTVITLNIEYVMDLNGISLIAHEYEYSLYEEDGGTYSFSFDYGIIPGAYFRKNSVSGSANVTYATLDDFHAAVDVTLENYRFESTEASNGFEARISIFSNSTATCSLITEYNGTKTAVANGEATVSMVLNEAGNAVEGYVIKGTHDAMGDFEISVSADYSGFPWAVSFMGVDFDFDMQPVEIPAE